ncbi:FUSC family protein [Methylobacterium sp. Leaf118]|uniref:FUSC family protein n=1 Tax=Methylobacterium sp. Leaf118 TaxID=2876562 RepID=UPI001E35E450|nr:FUSC family protein [Methylobacterium sp. Leaf118]
MPFGIRTALASLAALWLAMWLQLDTPRWAAWTVMSLALPTRGLVAQKGAWRMIGTLLGLVAGVVGIAAFAQTPIALGLYLALWFGLSAFVGGSLPGLASYGAALGGLTAGLIVVLSADAPLSVFETALARGAGISVGIACVYAASALAEIGRGPPPASPAPPMPTPDVVLANAFRTFLVVGSAWAIWIATAWPSGGFFVAFAGVVSIIFATMPDSDRRAQAYLGGVAVGQIAGLAAKYALLGTPAAFEILAAVLFPFLFIGAVAVTDPRTTGAAIGYNLSFLTAVDPTNPMQYDLIGSLNECLAVFAGIAFAVAAFEVVLPARIWRIAR